MSRVLLDGLDEARAFDATHRFEDLELFHVPFDELLGRPLVEGALARLAANQGRVGLIGPSGAGKSSAISSVLGPLSQVVPERVIPLRIPVAAAGTEEVEKPAAFAVHLVRTVLRYSGEVLDVSQTQQIADAVAGTEQIQLPRRVNKVRVGAARLLLNAEIATEVQGRAKQVETDIASGEIVEGLRRLIATFREHDREPFLIIDDADTWLRVGGSERSELAEAFFDGPVRMLAKELDCGFAIALHDDYERLESFATLAGFLSSIIRVPTVELGTGGISLVLERRVQLFDSDAVLDDAIEPAALEVLGSLGAEGLVLRDILRVVDAANQQACSDGSELVRADEVMAAVGHLGLTGDPAV